LFLAIETSVFPAYVLVAQFKRDYFSLEATVKFFVFGVLATLLFAYGLAVIYGAVGATSFSSINSFISSSSVNNYVNFIILGLILLLASLAIKSTLVPLHVWAIDTYQGSPTSISVFLSTTSKLTGLFSVALILVTAFRNLFDIEPFIRYLLAILALVTMILPNVAALVQKNIKRLLAYSSVAHAGYMSLVFVFPLETFPILGFYAVTYSIAKSVSFLVTKRISGEGSDSPYNNLMSLFKLDPLAATTFTVALLSLAGIPPFAGFMAKFLLFLNTAFTGNLGLALALVALIMSGISVYYYAYLIRLEVIESNNENISIFKNSEMDAFMIISIIALVILTFFPSYLYYQFPIF
ncbi:MAG TPA: proton-conducting transporter membrane subunit, partial [Geobacterales bacterium]|nr:proton-conducting transporter membrane subunit [Geobacterales bacterium]